MMMKRIYVLIVALIVLFGVLFYSLGLFGVRVQKREVENKIKSLYELANPGAIVEVVGAFEESGIYKIILKIRDVNGITYREVYVTKDGRLLTEGVIFVEESIVQIEKMKKFVDCLDEKGVRIYGVTNQTATLLQLNLLGRYSTKLLIACDLNLERCLAANITQVPSVVAGRIVDVGIKNIDWFERVTGCRL
ncbi:MAG: hypothetical protein QXX38_02080 [Candidatus Aenigmatarchaeota archaeon]